MARAVSKTAMLLLVKDLRAAEVRAVVASNPALLEARDKRGRNWLHIACGVNVAQRKLPPRAAVRTADALLDAGLALESVAFREDDGFEATPLWYSVAWGRNLALAKHLVTLGANNDDRAMVRLLVQHGAPIEGTAENATPLLFAIQWSRFKSAEELLKLGANPNYRNPKGVTPLHCLLKKGAHPKQVRMLIEHGAIVDVRNVAGKSAAEIIARKRDPAYRRLAAQLAAHA
jgi:ankyrin repeat protein